MNRLQFSSASARPDRKGDVGFTYLSHTQTWEKKFWRRGTYRLSQVTQVLKITREKHPTAQTKDARPHNYTNEEHLVKCRPSETKLFVPHKHGLTVPGEAGGRDETLAQGLLSLVRYGPVVGEDSTLQLVQVGGGKLHAAPRAVPVFIIAPLETHIQDKITT